MSVFVRATVHVTLMWGCLFPDVSLKQCGCEGGSGMPSRLGNQYVNVCVILILMFSHQVPDAGVSLPAQKVSMQKAALLS